MQVRTVRRPGGSGAQRLEQMTLQRAQEWTEFSLKVLSIVAILATGTWAYYQFNLARTDIANVEVSVTADVQPYSDDLRLLLIRARPHNIGKVLVTLSKGFTISVKRIPQVAKAGPLDLEELTKIHTTNLLRSYDSYQLEPGIKYDELLVFLVPKGIYAVEAVIDLGAEGEVDHKTIVRVE